MKPFSTWTRWDWTKVVAISSALVGVWIILGVNAMFNVATIGVAFAGLALIFLGIRDLSGRRVKNAKPNWTPEVQRQTAISLIVFGLILLVLAAVLYWFIPAVFFI